MKTFNKAKPGSPSHLKFLFLRKALNISQKEIAALLGIGQSLYSKYERGERPIPYDHLAHFSNMFGVSVFQFKDCEGLDILYYFGVKKRGLLNSTQLNSTQLNSTQLKQTQRGFNDSITDLKKTDFFFSFIF